VYTHLKETDSHIDFIVERCCALPELYDDASGGGDWRNEG
jgi:hypothetical protein